MEDYRPAESRRVRHLPDTELLHKSKPEPARRIKMFTGTGRRRAWTADQKAQIIAESYAGGETVCSVARRLGLTPQQLFGWRREARKQTVSASNESGACFAPVIVEPSGSHPGAPITAAAPSSTAIVEILIGSATVRIAPGIDAMTLATVLRAVRAIT